MRHHHGSRGLGACLTALCCATLLLASSDVSAGGVRNSYDLTRLRANLSKLTENRQYLERSGAQTRTGPWRVRRTRLGVEIPVHKNITKRRWQEISARVDGMEADRQRGTHRTIDSIAMGLGPMEMVEATRQFKRDQRETTRDIRQMKREEEGLRWLISYNESHPHRPVTPNGPWTFEDAQREAAQRMMRDRQEQQFARGKKRFEPKASYRKVVPAARWDSVELEPKEVKQAGRYFEKLLASWYADPTAVEPIGTPQRLRTIPGGTPLGETPAELGFVRGPYPYHFRYHASTAQFSFWPEGRLSIPEGGTGPTQAEHFKFIVNEGKVYAKHGDYPRAVSEWYAVGSAPAFLDKAIKRALAAGVKQRNSAPPLMMQWDLKGSVREAVSKEVEQKRATEAKDKVELMHLKALVKAFDTVAEAARHEGCDVDLMTKRYEKFGLEARR